MIPAATTTLNMVRFELLKAEKQLALPDQHAHAVCLEALWKTYHLARPHTRREDNKMPFSEIPQPIVNARNWSVGAAEARKPLQAALKLHQQMQQGQLGWTMWNQLADHVLEAMHLL
ncbi:hypothetical protein [Deinococcus roseus]|uniref:Transposase n=1 Tax=Deinococcus roseus TaxID=392414 RepID=A0ABQ2D257_9DEIO|nr:hypothetical protein [Deinococcus roseus]GGJ42737.1 hypothetical protein GCM10008938_31130 [Deinococcus roseus]